MSEYQNQQNDLNSTFQTALEALQEKDDRIAELTLTLSECKQIMQEQAQTITHLQQKNQEITEATVKRNESDNELSRAEDLKRNAEREKQQNEKQKNELKEQEKRLNTQQVHLSEIEEKNKQDKADIDRKTKKYNKLFNSDLKKRKNAVIYVGCMFAYSLKTFLLIDFIALIIMSEQCRQDIKDIFGAVKHLIMWEASLFDQNALYFVIAMIIDLAVLIFAIWGIYKLLNAITESVREELIKTLYLIIINAHILIRALTDWGIIWMITPVALIIVTFICLSGSDTKENRNIKKTLQEIYWQ